MVLLAALAGGVLVAVLTGSVIALGLVFVGLPVLLLAADLSALLVAVLLGIRLRRIEVGGGRPLRQLRRGHRRIVLRAVPLGVAWSGHARGRRLVRARFWIAHLSGLVVLAALSATALAHRPWQGVAAAGLVLLAGAFLPLRDGLGRPAGGRQLVTIPRMTDDEVAEWWQTRLGGQALDAALAQRDARALELAERALQRDPDDRAALEAKGFAAEHLGDTATALTLAERTVGRGDVTAQIIGHANLGWALVRAAEAGDAPDDWRARATEALDTAEELGGRVWEIDSSRALLLALCGRPTTARELMEWPLVEAVHPTVRAQVLLTLAHVLHGLGDDDGARDALAEASLLGPGSPRIKDVERALSAPPPG